MLETPTVSSPSAPASWRGWAEMRALLLVVTAVIVLAASVWGEHHATLHDLQDDVVSGRVSRVRVSDDLPPGATGVTHQDARWRTGWSTHEVEVELVAGPVEPSTMTGDDGSILPVTHRDLGALVQGWDPDVRVDRVERGSGPHFSGVVLGVGVPGWVGLLVASQWLGAVFLLVDGPDPRWASRWAWFWLSALPLGVTAFLLLSGPLPGRRFVEPGPRRLRGGWAFVVSSLLAGVVGGAGAL